ncbi:transposase [Glaciibacter sp. 2TAF33]|uniref:transposase n=1 Tax=Glaciibacter sp. 2TAF33 TaxID=3233015 RepID=UPI003F8F8D76
MPSRTKTAYSFEFKLDLVRRVLCGEAAPGELAQEHGISSPNLVKKWVRAYRRDGEDALRPKPRGRPKGNATLAPLTELERLQQENERLAAENAYLKKLRALRAQGRQ